MIPAHEAPQPRAWPRMYETATKNRIKRIIIIQVLVLLEEIKTNQGNLFSDLRLDALRRDLSGFEIADERMNWVKQEIAAGTETTCPKCGEKFNEQQS